MKNTRIVMRKERGTSYCHLALIKIKKRNNDFFKDKRRKKDWTLNYTCILRLLVFFFQHQKS